MNSMNPNKPQRSDKKQTKIYSALVWVIMGVGLLARLVNVKAFSIYNDSGHYAFRALGWFDYLASPTQTTPIQWFGKIPWWSYLSFHDAPPLAFLIQKISFTFFGANIVALRLPGILFALVCAYVIFLIVRRFYTPLAGVVAAALFSFSSYSVFNSISGNLEAVEILFITLTIFFFLHFVSPSAGVPQRAKWLYFFAASLGLAMTSKYTAMFLIPSAALFLLIWERSLIKVWWKKCIVAFVIFLLVLSPVIVYNSMVYVTRAHFDSAISAIVGMHPADFKLISDRTSNANFVDNFKGISSSLFNNNSLGLLILTLAAFIYLGYLIIRRRANGLEKFVFLSTAFCVLMFLFSGATARWLTVIIPFFIIALSIFVHAAVMFVRERGGKAAAYSLVVFFSLLFAGEIFYSINTNVLAKPVLHAPWFYSESRFYDDGTQALSDYLKKEIFNNLPDRKTPEIVDEIGKFAIEDIKGKSVIFFDDRILWFSYMWYLYPHRVYSHWPIFSLSTLLEAPPKKMLDEFKKSDAKDFYLIYITPDGPKDPVATELYGKKTNFTEVIEGFEKTNKPAASMQDSFGRTTFKVFKF